MTNAMEGKSKMTYFMEGKREWEPENPPAYINKLTRKQASVIFKSRTRMIQTKGNYKNGHTDLTCRACKNMPETQQHVLQECPKIHPYGNPTNKEIDPFSKDINVLKETVRNIERIVELINNGSMGMSQRDSVSPASTQ